MACAKAPGIETHITRGSYVNWLTDYEFKPVSLNFH
jgi:hypothetical protein